MDHIDKKRAGHAAAFQEAFERLNDELFRHASLRLSNRERAVELTQECFLKAWEYAAKGNEIQSYRPFLYRILNNLIIDEYRRKHPQSLDTMLASEETHDALEGELLTDEGVELEEACTRFEGKLLLGVLTELPALYRDVLILRYIDGLSVSEIAEAVGETHNVVSVRIHRALKKLRERFEEHHGTLE